ncbi:tetratricopeptide repeat protein [Propionibacteriaceae bacterium Y1685]|uniref:tetratricopeptide repeat protein n=1 Tax=Microlunatus sp. Y1700 TaxID=3418487 RepID=UPI003B7F4CE9
MTTALYWKLAEDSFEQKDYRSAVQHLDRVLAEAPDTAAALELRARAHFHRASLPPAEVDLRALLELEPTNEYAMLLLARTLERQDRRTEARGVRRVLAVVTGNEEHLADHRAFA